jgi:hypothetical protein
MGRWAYFNTGLEYKFSFGSQESSDILDFGGISSEFQRVNEDEYYYIPTDVTWSAEELPTINEILEELEKAEGIQRTSFEKFPFTLDGTNDLYTFLCDQGNISSKYRLGLLIYHQLQYETILNASFEW